MKRENERGAIILESTYCILVSIFVLMFLISFGFFLYQKTIVTVVANEIAEEISQTYKLRNVQDSSSLSSSDISGIGKYRYLFFTKSFDSKNKAKAQNLADIRLTQTSLAKKEGNLSVDVNTVVDDIGRRHYEVTVRQKYSFLLGELLRVIGLQEVQTLEATAYVESVDVLNYINTVKVTKYGIDKITEYSDKSVVSASLKVIDTVISTLHSIFSIS